MKKQALCLSAILFLFSFLSNAQYVPIDESNLETVYVSTSGNDTDAGSGSAPFRTIKKALAIAAAKKRAGVGVKILIAAGTYREGAASDGWAMTLNMSLSQATAAPLVIQGAGWNAKGPKNTGDVIISGSEDWSGGWTKNADGTWSKDWPYAFGVPAKNVSFGVSDAFLRRELVHINGKTYYQVNPPNYTNVNGTVGGAMEGDPGNPNNVNGGRATADEGLFWVTDAVLNNGTIVTMGKITVKLPQDSPPAFDLNAQGNLVEVTTKRNLLQLWLGTQSETPTNIILRNLTFQQAYNYVLIQHQNNLLIEDCRFIKNKRDGLAINPGKNYLLRRVECSENGESGAGIVNTTNGVLEECKFNRNSRQGEILGYTGWSVCGIKFYAPLFNRNISLIRCEAVDNRSSGFWWDTGNVNCEMVECISVRNSTNGTFIEDNNSVGNNYEGATTGTTGVTGIPNLGNQHTVKALRCIFAHNRPASGTEGYRTTKGRGIFFSENENAVIDGCLIYNNDIQISTYDNSRAENRNFTFRNNIIATQNTNQRMYAVGSNWDSGETITAKNSNGTVIATFKGGWYGLFDGMSGTTNDNRYYHPSSIAFFSRSQRWGTDKWVSQVANTTPTLTLDAWRNAHLSNSNNTFANKAVDSRSTLVTSTYDEALPLVSIIADSVKISENSPTAKAFTVHRVAINGYANPLTVNYTLRANTGDATNGTDFETLSGTITIPAGARSATISITPKTDSNPEATETIALLLNTTANNYVVANPLATISLVDATITSIDDLKNASEKKLIIFPNPLSDRDLSIALRGLESNESVNVSIIDVSGKLIYQINVKSQNNGIETMIKVKKSFFTEGIYIVKSQSDKGLRLEQKLVVH
ncbi:right-handed parallel beta-helix repeat-containing protein [Runella slithyformis]|uniref:T9SS type A sorting domain-containing protein n=1 Tax=Runella slithyformis (strain ATCC 29530 / DSM 19594 / LMG 11500 / NCIMB 11436 / LSU 4) TaxID=761193 RepID=A0A7U4E5H4_RUNSL|nr:right-handed parallel beta-helix repeat-containing protein [Runella slithyformis]AEI48339.1 protein of unknown function DUF1565 [Runella slithyformis DSM 19594]